MSKKPENLTSADFPSLSWQPNQLSEELAKLFAYATGEATRAIAYYAAKREPKKLGARVLRLGAIFATTVAALIPVFSQIFERAGKPIIAPAWSTVAAGIAVLFILLDKFWGFTGAWVRFMVTEQVLAEALTAFRINSESKKLAWGGKEPSQEQAREMVAEYQAFLAKIHKIVQAETTTWVTEFQGVVAQQEQAAKAAGKVGGTGSP
jgi:hypothetical protein